VRRVIDPGDPAHQQIWIRPRVRPLAPEPALQHCALLFLSDFTILWPTMTVHGLDPGQDRHSVLGSVAHTMWFHRDGRADDWLLYDQRTPTTSGGLGHAEGRIFSRSGVLLATVAQVGLLRPGRIGANGGGPARRDGR
jgi:acyl-CoA thioesterase-2